MPADLTSNPLHFETQPSSGAPEHARTLGTGMLVAWAASRVGLAKKHAKSDAAKKLAAREMTGREFLVGALKGKFTDADLGGKPVADFLYGYTHRLFLDDSDRDHKAVAKTLGLERKEDEIAFSDDYLAAFKKAVKNPFLIPDTWTAFDRFAPILDARWADYQATKFVKKAPKGIYEKAVKARDAVKVDVPKVKVDAPVVAADLTEQLMSLVGRSLKDKAVKDVLTANGLPVGKKIDEQALPKLGVSYFGVKIKIDGERELGIDSVEFHAKNNKSYIRGLRAEVQFAQYPGALPKGVEWGDNKAKLVKKLGKISRDHDDYFDWNFKKEKRRLFVRMTRKKIASVGWCLPIEKSE